MRGRNRHSWKVECSATSRRTPLCRRWLDAARPETDPSLRWAADVGALVESAPTDGIDWDKLVTRARRHRLGVQTGQALAVVRRVADLPVPRETIDDAPCPVGRTCRLVSSPSTGRQPSVTRTRRSKLSTPINASSGARCCPAGDPLRWRRRASSAWWGLQRLREVPVHGVFVAAGLPWSLAALGRHRHPAPSPPLELGHTVRFGIGDDGCRDSGVGWSFPEEVGTWTMTRAR